ncbi:hypothetical protein DT019_28360 [Streptomyces sp. SDr-06]|uniref:hypothetical protein n=1 Tax=Streptomyces sp. SDr-06 TaxID=2267702 RepID=UPI000DE94543|nr:hypothetical protein [Streptomyces sp. SDr-06]RCH65383.1 hypothetical protein DT019_28360 [Streptomyces sp. SDr-06]
MPFEDRLGEALRRTGDSFELGDRRDLVESGLLRGRRRLARRRMAAVTGSVLALATVGLGGAYAAGFVGGDGAGASVAAPPPQPQASGGIGGQRMIVLFTSSLPPGKVTQEQGRGPADPQAPGGPGGGTTASASGVFDDGKGAGLVSLGVSRVDPAAEPSGQQVTCPARAFVDYDACKAEQLADGSRYLFLQGYEYPDRREPTKEWRAVLITPKGTMVEASEWNAPAEKGAAVSRDTPPLTAEQLRTLVTSPKWLSVADGLRAPGKPDRPAANGPSGEAVQKQLLALLPSGKGLKVVERGNQDGYAFAVVDDGKGKSLVEINVQPRMSDVSPQGEASTLPDGTRIGLDKRPGEKGGDGVVGWTADTVRPDGFRVVVSAYNTGNQSKPATRTEPALSLAELKAIALDPHWLTFT